MAIKVYTDKKTGKIVYEAYVNVTSETYPNIRVQRRKTQIDTKTKALRAEKELYNKAYKAVREKENKGYNWGIAVNKWFLFELNNDFSKIGRDSLEDYLNSMKIWTKNFWDKPIYEVRRTDIQKLLQEMVLAGKSKSYQSKIKQTINKIFMWSIDENLIPRDTPNPTLGIKINRKEEKPPERLSLEEVKIFLSAAKNINHPWYPVWSMALLTGCRNGELYALTWDDVNLENRQLEVSKSYNTRRREVKSTKAGYWRNVPINDDLKSLLVELKNNANGRKEVLPRLPGWEKGNQAKILRTFLSGLGIKSVKFHTLRACFATMMLQNNVAPATLMKICGWRDMDTMGRYIRLAAIDEKGATEKLTILPKEAMNNVINFS